MKKKLLKSLQCLMLLAVCAGITEYRVREISGKYNQLQVESSANLSRTQALREKLLTIETKLIEAQSQVKSLDKSDVAQSVWNMEVVKVIRGIGNELDAIDSKSVQTDTQIISKLNELHLMFIALQTEYINKTSEYLTPDELREKLLAPSVKISIYITRTYNIYKQDGSIEKKTVDMMYGSGSGTIIYSEKKSVSSTEYESYILTCSHLIDYLGPDDKLKDVIITLFDYTGGTILVSSEVVVNTNSIDGKDIMILKIKDDKKYPVAQAMSGAEFSRLGIFDKVYNVGAGLGLRPYPGPGEITGLYTEYPGLGFLYQISAPSVPGNSGGGIFDAKTGKVIGILVRGGAYQGVMVYHQAYMVPMSVIIEFLKENNLDYLLK